MTTESTRDLTFEMCCTASSDVMNIACFPLPHFTSGNGQRRKPYPDIIVLTHDLACTHPSGKDLWDEISMGNSHVWETQERPYVVGKKLRDRTQRRLTMETAIK